METRQIKNGIDKKAKTELREIKKQNLKEDENDIVKELNKEMVKKLLDMDFEEDKKGGDVDMRF